MPRLRLLDVDTGATRPLAARRLAHNASWAPDGKRLVVEDYGTSAGQAPALAVIALRTGRAHRITRAAALDESPAWAPNGRRIVFARAPLAGSDDGLWLVNPSGGSERHVTYNRFGDTCPSWSPDGRQIVFARSRNGLGGRNLYLGDASGGNRHLLVRNGGRATWSRDGSRIVFVRWEGRRTHLWLIGSDGTGLRKLTGGTRSQRAPAWQP